MIVDSLSRCQRYFKIHPGFEEAFQFLIQASRTQTFHPSRTEIAGKQLIAIFEQVQGKSRQGAVLEAHRQYIDIQYTFSGFEEIGWKPLEECQQIKQDYQSDKDIAFFSDAPSLWIPLPATTFAIFFPEDAHAPLAAMGSANKIIMKVAVPE
ncbi:YhcH/YjgK/YiaL family protein [Candidatus Protochlamydia phocaeensis]|uniref:YhcH/YjgK/YiaL family protein n=1 Tax=Candidatus Protochlamydia phocaeensis TaxID=1414722 RepID=UPI0008391CBF|nr:YhcH/YjgK/YiaL family protein [Candidatus Protochlamydia phocaeensis]